MQPFLWFALLTTLASASEQGCGASPSAPICEKDSTCCMDSPGCKGYCSECCLNQLTMCVEPRGQYTTSTCCPKWTIGCTTGSVGCCDPARPWQEHSTSQLAKHDIDVEDDFVRHVLKQPNLRRHSNLEAQQSLAVLEEEEPLPVPPTGTANASGYAIFTRALIDGLSAYTFDAATGAVIAKHPITGPAGTYFGLYYGQAPRVLPWDPNSKLFYLADVDAAASANATAITLYAINPADGSSTATPVSGCEGFPMGMSWDEALGMLIVATQTPSTVTFCAIDPSGTSKSMGSLPRGSSESTDTSYYAAYISHAQAGVAVRVGHKIVTEGKELGVSTVKLSGGANGGSSPTATWTPLDLGSHDLPAATLAHPSGKGFLGLAPRKKTTSAADAATPYSLDMIAWELGAAPRVIGNLTNSYPPQSPMTHSPLGYVTDAFAGGKYASMTVSPHPFPILPGTKDKWVVSTLDLETGKLTQAPLKPQPSIEGAETVSLAGFGLVAA